MSDIDEMMEKAAMSIGDFGESVAEDALLESVDALCGDGTEFQEIVGECYN